MIFKELITDIHCHILPGIDDGAADWDMSLKMLRLSWNAGVRTLIATPHYLPWQKTVIARAIPGLCTELMARAKKQLGITPLIMPGQELYYYHDLPKDLASGKALPLAGGNYILVEFNEEAPWSEINQAAMQFARSPWRLIIAHAERYTALRDDSRLHDLLSYGVQLQSNADEMNHGFMNSTKRWLKKRYAAGDIRYIGSDMHNLTDRPPLSIDSLQWMKILSKEYRSGLLHMHAEDILTSGS